MGPFAACCVAPKGVPEWLRVKNAAAYRHEAAALYELARNSVDGMERLAYVLRAMECEERAADAERERLPPPDL